MFRKVIEPVEMTDDEKFNWLANAHVGSIFPTAFQADDELTLIALLARRIAELEAKCQNLP
jgi:hypothetical protein